MAAQASTPPTSSCVWRPPEHHGVEVLRQRAQQLLQAVRGQQHGGGGRWGAAIDVGHRLL